MFGFFKKGSKWKNHFERGMSAGGAGDLRAACEHFQKATEAAPEEPYPHYELGYTLFLLGRYEDALGVLKRTNELSPGFFLVQTEIYLCEGVLSGQLDDRTLSLLRQLQQLSDTGRPQSPDAVSLSQEVIEAAPDCALGHYYLGKALFEADRERSESALQRAIDLSPDDTTAIDALLNLGFHREASGDLESARKMWTDVLTRYQGNPHSRMAEVILSQREST
jgi:tetratricopeptide (TPR) repeat protein